MFQRDFLLKQIEEFGRFLGYVMKLRKDGKSDLALAEVSTSYSKLLDFDKSIVMETSLEDLIEILVVERHLPLHKLNMISDLLYEEGENLIEVDKMEAAGEAFQKCLLLINYLSENDETFSFEWLMKKDRIQEFTKRL